MVLPLTVLLFEIVKLNCQQMASGGDKPEIKPEKKPEVSLADGPRLVINNPPPVFEGRQGDDFETWVDRFETWGKVYAPRKEDMLLYFPTLLGNSAFAIWRELPLPVKGDYDAVKQSFVTAFSSPAMIDAFRAELKSRDRRPDENLVAYAGELKALARRAYPKYNTEARNDVVLTSFLKGLGDMGRKVRKSNPRTVEEAIEKAARIEVREEIEKGRGKHVASLGSERDDDNDIQIAASALQGRKMEQEKFVQMERQLEEIQNQISALTTRQRDVITCYNCGGQGHIARTCPSKGPTNYRGRQRGRGGRGGRGSRGRGSQGKISYNLNE